jgi:hypothetical protein
MAHAPPPTPDVFISYHSGDADWVVTLAADLKALGVIVWLDREKLRAGDLFVQALEDALASVRCVVVVVSAGALRSAWVQMEVQRALTLVNAAPAGERRIIALLIDDAEPSGFLAIRSWIDFRDPAQRARKLAQLAAAITGRPPSTPGAPDLTDDFRREALATMSPGIDEIEFLGRLIERTRVEAQKLRMWRLLGCTPGLSVVLGLWGVWRTLPEATLGALLVGAPLFTLLIAWAATHTSLSLCGRKAERFEVLRDGLQLCHQRTNPGCRTLRERFWEMVLNQTGQMPVSRSEE